MDNNNKLGGHFLCSGNLSDFKATGELGQSVYQVATALRDTIRRHSKSIAPLERFLAIPYENPQSNSVDWYADASIPTRSDEQTVVINWNQADAAEQKIAKEKILHFKDEIIALSESISKKQNNTTNDLYLFSQLLPKTLITPTEYGELKDGKNIIDPSYLFLVGSDQQPVLAFWGFSHPNTPLSSNPFHFLSNPRVAAAAPIATPSVAALATTPAAAPPIPPISPAVEEKRSVWSWLRWLLLALLLSFLLFFVWRSCTKPAVPTLPNIGIPNASLTEPNTALNPPSNRLWGMNLPNMSWPNWLPKFGLGAGTPNTPAMPAAAPALPNTPTVPTAVPTTPATPDTPAMQPQPQQPPTLPALGPELQIPPQLASQAMPSYINGQWQVYGIQEQNTGLPVRLEYNIKDGEGAVRIHKPDGMLCNGSVQAAGLAAGLQINSTSQAACADGSTYDMPEIECGLNAHQQTECFGRYGNQQFPISMRHATE